MLVWRKCVAHGRTDALTFTACRLALITDPNPHVYWTAKAPFGRSNIRFSRRYETLLNIWLQLWWSNKHIITSSMPHEVEILKVKVLDIVLRFAIKY